MKVDDLVNHFQRMTGTLEGMAYCADEKMEDGLISVVQDMDELIRRITEEGVEP